MLLPGIKLFQLKSFSDERGFFSEIYRQQELQFVQDNLSFSKKGVIRGMHYQSTPGQAKLVTVITGKIYDVFVDIRPESETFGKWGAVELDPSMQILIPVGFAHGFAVLSDSAHVLYKVSNFYNPETEKSFRFDDPTVGIKWPIAKPILSKRDQCAPGFEGVCR
ncbi:MAG: dTDP-4-dehydrorhamnose 3,5-epimerase [Verrucomicrobia bacterium]|nr:dTDP-4-dehydrorhamnose 3,5-epimerase [Verrucomicrobiota bacterium]